MRKLSNKIHRHDLSAIYDNELDSVMTQIISSSKLRKELKNYLIVRQVAIIESILKKHVSNIIDNNHLDIIPLFDNQEFTISISNIDYIKKKDFTKGSIVATNFNFQNPNDINFVYSKLLQLDFFNLVKQSLTLPIMQDSVRFSKKANQLLKFWEELMEISEIRNEIVHSIDKTRNQKKSLIYYKRIYANVLLFTIICTILSEAVLDFKKGKPIYDDLKKLIAEKLDEYKKKNN